MSCDAQGSSAWARSARAGLGFRAAGEDDLPFLFRVHASTRERELAMLPFTDEQKRAFLDMQARAQHLDYARSYPKADHLVIAASGAPAGRLMLDRRERTHHILDIAFLPEARNRGFGGALLADLIEEAAAAGRSVSLHVRPDNPARRLYARLGFVTVEEREIDRLMVASGSGRA